MALLKDLLSGLENITSDLQPGIQQLAKYAIAERDRKDENARFQQQFKLMQKQDVRAQEELGMRKDKDKLDRQLSLISITSKMKPEDIQKVARDLEPNDPISQQFIIGFATKLKDAETEEERKGYIKIAAENGYEVAINSTAEQAMAAIQKGKAKELEQATREKEATIGEKNANIAESGFRGQLYKAKAENIGKPGERGSVFDSKEYHKFVNDYIATHPNIPGVDMEKEAADIYFQRLQYMRTMEKMLNEASNPKPKESEPYEYTGGEMLPGAWMTENPKKYTTDPYTGKKVVIPEPIRWGDPVKDFTNWRDQQIKQQQSERWMEELRRHPERYINVR